MKKTGGKALLDLELAWPIGWVLFATAGLVFSAFAAYQYFRFERIAGDSHVPVAICILAIHYALVVGLAYAPVDYLLRMILVFLMAVALVLVIWIGSLARSMGGRRMLWAGALTLASFVCRLGHYTYQSTKFSWR
jgi:uncharacterized membrane protein